MNERVRIARIPLPKIAIRLFWEAERDARMASTEDAIFARCDPQTRFTVRSTLPLDLYAFSFNQQHHQATNTVQQKATLDKKNKRV